MFWAGERAGTKPQRLNRGMGHLRNAKKFGMTESPVARKEALGEDRQQRDGKVSR